MKEKKQYCKVVAIPDDKNNIEIKNNLLTALCYRFVP